MGGVLQVHGIRSCRLMWLRLDQTMRNLTSGDLGILFVVVQLRVNGLKKTKVVYLLDLFEGRGEKGQWDLVILRNVGTPLDVVMLISIHLW